MKRQCLLAFGLTPALLFASPLYAQDSNTAADIPQLRDYVFTNNELPRSAASSIADLILAIDGLPGLSATVKRNQPKTACPTTAGQRRARLQCELLGQAGQLLTAANSPIIDDKLNTLDSWILAGRYDMGGKFYALAERYGGRHVEEIREQLDLGSIDFVQDDFRKLDRTRLKARSTSIRFVSSGGSFTFAQGAITIDTLGIKRLIVADFLFASKGFVRLSDCLSGRWANEHAETFCNNMLERTRVLEGMDKASFKPAKPGADLLIGPGGTVADAVADWREWYGLSYVEAYFDEAWNYLFALSREATEREAAGTCSGACGREQADYVSGPREPLLRQMIFVMAHELSHQLLGHADQAVRPQESRESGCDRALWIETEADVFGVLLTRLAAPAPASDDYWTWGPFFDGYVALFESGRSRCGYFSGQARHIMFQLFYTDQTWDD